MINTQMSMRFVDEKSVIVKDPLKIKQAKVSVLFSAELRTQDEESCSAELLFLCVERNYHTLINTIILSWAIIQCRSPYVGTGICLMRGGATEMTSLHVDSCPLRCNLLPRTNRQALWRKRKPPCTCLLFYQIEAIGHIIGFITSLWQH